jgi:hypothetical protein
MNGIAAQIGWPVKKVRLKVFRVTYASAPIQTLDGGAPVSDWTVQQKMGHSGVRPRRRDTAAARTRRYIWSECASAVEAKLEVPTTLPEKWRRVLRALPRRGAIAKEWQLACDVPVGTYHYIREQFAVRGLIVRDGHGVGSQFRRAVPEVLGGDAAPLDLLRAG